MHRPNFVVYFAGEHQEHSFENIERLAEHLIDRDYVAPFRQWADNTHFQDNSMPMRGVALCWSDPDIGAANFSPFTQEDFRHLYTAMAEASLYIGGPKLRALWNVLSKQYQLRQNIDYAFTFKAGIVRILCDNETTKDIIQIEAKDNGIRVNVIV